MDREQEEMQFLGLFGIYQESYKIILSYRRVFSKITLALILPLSFIFLAHMEISEFLMNKIMNTEYQMLRTRQYTSRYDHLRHTVSSEETAFWLFQFAYITFFLIFSLLSTSAVVYTVASIYTGRDVSFGKIMSVVPKVWKRLMVTFLCMFLAFFLYNVVAVLTIIIWSLTVEYVNIVGPVFFVLIFIFYAVGSVYMTLIWQLASVVSVLEDIKGFKAMTKSKNLLKGKMWIAIAIFFKLNLATLFIKILFESQVVVSESSFGVVGRLGFGLVCLLLLFKVFLFGLVIQTVIYFVCKSYHHENIDKSTLSDHLEVYLGEYVPLKSKDVQLEQFDV